ncbi:hypothetical protein M409DRAFT_53952 [Zasmidium cellare ATCC 36951]|uniref:Uncharacterized protein n=1 Tax=Zasmidium cellare ATCC 36951 TaxID=1080233 RepID=A0A6A6CPG1_ZASCE|nr:uncharacterized protein M409DRAFT_53952 [Zasmidium cellare ATCC 36951]KAF2167346.1 hypothetical protein M409DRAFT_53952 [Zasmidium cellare ATCC 36951]
MAPNTMDRIQSAYEEMETEANEMDAALEEAAKTREEKLKEYRVAFERHREVEKQNAQGKEQIQLRREKLYAYISGTLKLDEGSPELEELLGLEKSESGYGDDGSNDEDDESEEQDSDEDYASPAPSRRKSSAIGSRRKGNTCAEYLQEDDDQDDEETLPFMKEEPVVKTEQPVVKKQPSSTPPPPRQPIIRNQQTLVKEERASNSPADLPQFVAPPTAAGSGSTPPQPSPGAMLDAADSEVDNMPPRKKKKKAARKFQQRATKLTADEFLAQAEAWDYLPSSSTIVKNANGTWVELRCPECGGNVSHDHGKLLKGIKGFLTHIKKYHGYSGKSTLDEAAGFCTHREVPMDEVKKILNGGDKGMPYVQMVVLENETSAEEKVEKDQEQQFPDWSLCKKTGNFLARCSCVRRHPDGNWVEIACVVCGGNFNPSKGQFQKDGLKGFVDHIAHVHDPWHWRMPGSVREIIDVLKVRDLSDEEVDSIKKRKMAVTSKPCFSTVPYGKKAKPRKRSRDEMEDGIDEVEGDEDGKETMKSYLDRLEKAKDEAAEKATAEAMPDQEDEDEVMEDASGAA